MSEKGIEQMVINFNPDWFKSGYYVYVLKIEHKTKGIYFYIGQTGDRYHVSARSPFYRLMGHYNTYNSSKGSDAQLINGLVANNIIKPTKEKSKRVCVEEAIVNKTLAITANYFKISDFGKLDHQTCREMVEEIELKLIQTFRSKKHKLFNDDKKIGSANETKINKLNIEKAEAIFKSLSI